MMVVLMVSTLSLHDCGFSKLNALKNMRNHRLKADWSWRFFRLVVSCGVVLNQYLWIIGSIIRSGRKGHSKSLDREALMIVSTDIERNLGDWWWAEAKAASDRKVVPSVACPLIITDHEATLNVCLNFCIHHHLISFKVRHNWLEKNRLFEEWIVRIGNILCLIMKPCAQVTKEWIMVTSLVICLSCVKSLIFNKWCFANSILIERRQEALSLWWRREYRAYRFWCPSGCLIQEILVLPTWAKEKNDISLVNEQGWCP